MKGATMAAEAPMNAGSRRSQRQRAAGPSKGEIRESQILDVTERLLRATRFAEITMDEIARHAGLSRSTMYFYFASKGDLLAALLARTHHLIAAPMNSLLTSGVPMDQAVRKVLENIMRGWREHGPALRTFLETAMISPEFGAKWRAVINENIDVAALFIDRQRTDGRLPAGPPSSHALSSAMFWMTEHAMYELFQNPHSRAAEAELLDTLTLLWQRGIGTP